MTDNQRKLAAYRQANPEAARIVAADLVKYPPGSLMAEWAVKVLAWTETVIDPPVAGPLFKPEAT